MLKYKNIVPTFFIILSVSNIIVHYFSGHSIQIRLFDSDALYLPTLFSDIFSKGGHIKDWFLTPAPYFFPDYPIFLLAYFAGSNPYIQIICFSLLQVALVFSAVWFLVKKTLNDNALMTATAILVTLTWLALTSGEPFSLILSSAFHYGIFLSSIIFITFWLEFKRENEKQGNTFSCLLMATLAFSLALSDNLFLIQVIAPLIATTILVSMDERKFSFKGNLLLVLVTTYSIFGSISYNWIVKNKTRYTTDIGLEKLFENLKDVYNIFYVIVIKNPIFGMLFILYIGIVLYSIARLIKGGNENKKIMWIAIFSFLSLCVTIGAVSLVTNLSIVSRYLIPTFSWPVIVVFIFMHNYLRGRFFPAAMVCSLLATASLSCASYQLVKKNGINTQHYPKDISCIDDVLEQGNVNNGIAQYWDAKYIKNFSRLNLNIAQYSDDLSEMRWITSEKYFKEKYDFVIISKKAKHPYKLPSEALVRINGAPKLVKNCGDKLVYVYEKNNLRVKKIFNTGNSYTWKACELPTIIGEKTAECEMRKKDNAQSGYVTFGPYEPLPTGQYTFEMTYSSVTKKADTIADWDVVVHLQKETKLLNNGFISGSDGATEKITGAFSLNAEENMREVEIRTSAKKNVDLKVISIRVERVK